jgi:hypothetical protein
MMDLLNWNVIIIIIIKTLFIQDKNLIQYN